ncbi:MAG TPA: SMC family ATPase, partial [Acidimicrobiales bacterium]|nr:SMC family ATPase [Acidimicrobiales bacterium]
AAAKRAEALAALAAHPGVDVLEAAMNAHARIARGHEVRTAREADRVEAIAAHDAAVRTVAAAETTEVATRATLDEIRRAHAAHDLAAHLVAGEPCPVCQQAVAAVPRRQRPAALASAEQRLDAAIAAVQQARDAATRAAAAVSRADAELAKVDVMLATLAEQVAAHPDSEALAARLVEVHAASAAADAARAEEEQAVKDAAGADDIVAQLEAAMAQAADLFHAQRDAVAAAAPPPPGPDLLESWQMLAAFAVAEHDAVGATAAAESARAADATAAYDVAYGQLIERAAVLGVTAPAGVSALTAAVVRAEEQAAAAVRQVEAAREERTRLRAEASEADERFRVAHELGRHLSSSGFPRWLVTEALDLLVADASALLLQLSEGKYSLVAVDDGSDLGVVDHANADEIRPVRSLSGGETFQASLAFALALSDHLASLAASGAARLDAIFLDEGFGTLDADSLDTVAATIDALAGGGRMVGIVTHVRELAERVPVRYVVTKGARTAAVTRSVA